MDTYKNPFDNHIEQSRAKSRLLLANAILDIMTQESLWLEEYFNTTNTTQIEQTLANHTKIHYGTTTINGLVKTLNITKLLENATITELKHYNLHDIKNAEQTLKTYERIYNIKHTGINDDGYIILSRKKISSSEIGINEHNERSYVREISALKNKVLLLESNLETIQTASKDKDAILAGRAGLTWS